MMAAGISTGSLTDGVSGQLGSPARSDSSWYMVANKSKATRPKCIPPQAGSNSVISLMGRSGSGGISPSSGTR